MLSQFANFVRASATNNSLQHQAVRGRHSYVRSSTISIYSNHPSVHPHRKFSFPLISPYDIHPSPARTTCVLFGPSRFATGTIFGNQSSSISRTCPSHFIFSRVIALETRIETYISYSLPLKIEK